MPAPSAPTVVVGMALTEGNAGGDGMTDHDQHCEQAEVVLQCAAIIWTKRNDLDLLSNVSFLAGYLQGWRSRLMAAQEPPHAR